MTMTTLLAAVARRLVAGYFELSFRLLDGPAGRAMLARAADGGPAVHGYTTRDDLEAIIAVLDPATDETLADLGCGSGAVAIEVHRRTGCRIVGIDVSLAAVAAARRTAAAAGLGPPHVQFRVGDLVDVPPGTSLAYSLDVLPFVPRPFVALAVALGRLAPPARAVVTTFGPWDRRTIENRLAAAEIAPLAIDDVTAEMLARSRLRAQVARSLWRRHGALRDRLAMILVAGEEAVVTRLVRAGRLRRWRLVVGPVTAARDDSRVR